MKVRYVCDCCDSVFEPTGAAGDEAEQDTDSLTEEEGHDIIEKSQDGSEMYVSSTCDECSRALGLDGEGDLVFLGRPILN